MNDKRDLEPNPHFFRGLLCMLGRMALLLAAGAFVVAFAAALSGCATEGGGLPPGALEFVTNHIDRIVSGHGGASSVDAPTSAQQQPGGDAGDAAGPVFHSVDIDWRFGGFDGSRAVEDPATQIEFLHTTQDGMSYQWASSSLRPWGLDDNDAGAIAAAFYWDGSRWVGGKFDWISTSRTTRDFKNIKDGYGGWDWAAFSGARRRAFCIVSKDGRKRTNIIEESR